MMKTWQLFFFLVALSSSTDDETDELIEWCKARGGGLGQGVAIGFQSKDAAPRSVIASIFGQQEQSLRGLVATEDLEANVVAATVPLLTGLPMHMSEWQRSYLGQHCTGIDAENLTKDQLLAAILAVEGSLRTSFWNPYIDALSIVDVPRTWNKEDLELLPDSLLRRAKEQRRTDRKAHRALLRACSLHAPRLESFSWALSVVSSRGRTTKIERDGQVDYLWQLVPLADLFNWSPNPNVRCESADDAFVCSTVKSVRSGESLTVAYEKNTPSDFLFNYGFVPTEGLACDESANRGDALVKYDVNKRDIQHVKYVLAHHAHYETRGDHVLNVLYLRRDCLRARLGAAAPDDDDDRTAASEL